jgi:hypothetical protein
MSKNIFETLTAAMDEYERNQNVREIVILPPLPDQLTDDEDMDDEGVFDSGVVHDVPGQLEVIMNDDSSSSKGEEEPLRSWRKTDQPRYTMLEFKGIPLQKLTHIHDELGGLSPIQLFDLMWEGCDDMIKVETERYAHEQCADHFFSVSVDEIRRFNGVLMLSGYNQLPSQRDYWSLQLDLGNFAVKSSLTRDRFLKIKKYLHLVDNNVAPHGPNQDRIFKVRPLYNLLGRNFMRFGVFKEDLSVDESMVPYYGRHTLKMFMRGKPVRFGFKNWCLCSSDGYCFKFNTYQGAEPKHVKKDPLGTRVVMDLIQDCCPEEHRLYFDNFFTSVNLLLELKKKGIRATGTVRDNRLHQVKNLTPVSVMKKKDRGFHSATFDRCSEILVVRWNDNNVVTIATNHDFIHPMISARRYCRTPKKIPNVINNYNINMGGVDVHDKLLGAYRIGIQGMCIKF